MEQVYSGDRKGNGIDMDGRKKKVGDLIVIAGIYLLAFALADEKALS